jgi:DNA polymerase III subunit beta
MNVTVNSQLLAAELRLLNKVVQNKPMMPILGYVLLRAQDESLHFMSTDHEVFLTTLCRAKVTKPGAVAVPALKMLMMCERFTDADVNISVEAGAVIIRSGTFQSRLHTLDHADFPTVPEIAGVETVFGGDVLRSLIARTRCAISESNQKYVLRGALLSMIDNAAVMVATDAKRLAVATGSRPGPTTRGIIPTKTLDIVSTIDAHRVALTVGDQHIFFAFDDDRVLISRMIEGEFPKYERIIPRTSDKMVSIERTALAAALRRVGTVSEESLAVFFKVTPDAIELSSSSVEVGFADEVVRASYNGPELTICVNGSYVLDFLEAATGSMITMSLKDATTPMLLLDGESYLTVVTPIRQQ